MNFLETILDRKIRDTRESIEDIAFKDSCESYGKYLPEFEENYCELIINHISLSLRRGDENILVRDILEDMSIFPNPPPKPIYNKDTNKPLSKYELEIMTINFLMLEDVPLLYPNENPQGWAIDMEKLQRKLAKIQRSSFD